MIHFKLDEYEMALFRMRMALMKYGRFTELQIKPLGGIQFEVIVTVGDKQRIYKMAGGKFSETKPPTIGEAMHFVAACEEYDDRDKLYDLLSRRGNWENGEFVIVQNSPNPRE